MGRSLRRSSVLAVGVALGTVCLAMVSCGSDDSEGQDRPTISSSTTSEASPIDQRYPDGLRGVRYCEVLLIGRLDGAFTGEVWNTMLRNDCPQAAWDELDGAVIASEREALAAVLNGPRYWTLDHIEVSAGPAQEETVFGDIEMALVATVDLGERLPDQSPYTERSVRRDTVFTFDAGSEVYLLVDPEGARYVMQSYSQIVDETMDESRLAGLGAELDLPPGWEFRAEDLDEDLEVRDAAGVATVVQDDLQNTYQRLGDR